MAHGRHEDGSRAGGTGVHAFFLPASSLPSLLRHPGLWSSLSQLQWEGHTGTMGVLRGGWGHSTCQERLGGSSASLTSMPTRRRHLHWLSGFWGSGCIRPPCWLSLLSAAPSEYRTGIGRVESMGGLSFLKGVFLVMFSKWICKKKTFINSASTNPHNSLWHQVMRRIFSASLFHSVHSILLIQLCVPNSVQCFQ